MTPLGPTPIAGCAAKSPNPIATARLVHNDRTRRLTVFGLLLKLHLLRKNNTRTRCLHHRACSLPRHPLSLSDEGPEARPSVLERAEGRPSPHNQTTTSAQSYATAGTF